MTTTQEGWVSDAVCSVRFTSDVRHYASVALAVCTEATTSPCVRGVLRSIEDKEDRQQRVVRTNNLTIIWIFGDDKDLVVSPTSTSLSWSVPSFKYQVPIKLIHGGTLYVVHVLVVLQ